MIKMIDVKMVCSVKKTNYGKAKQVVVGFDRYFEYFKKGCCFDMGNRNGTNRKCARQ